MICSDIWHKYCFVSNFTRLTALEITYNNFEISLVVFTPNITTNHAISITYTNICFTSNQRQATKCSQTLQELPYISRRLINLFKGSKTS